MTTTPAPLDPELERALKAIGACLAAVEVHVPKARAAARTLAVD